MSDLSIYELEDIIWGDFEPSGDHIVPHPSENQGSEGKCEGDACKKPRIDVTPIQSNEERGSKTLSEETNMMDKESWSNMFNDGVFAASGDVDSGKDKHTPTVQSGTGLCKDEGIVKGSSGIVDSNSYNDLNLFSNDGDGKESSDLLYYGWPDVGSFEDVDRMLSNYDSSFGLGATGNDDELVWFTSEEPSRGFEETLKMDLKVPCSEPSTLTNVSRDHEPRESDNKTSSFVSESKHELKDKDQHVNLQKEKLRQQNLTEGLKAGHWHQNKNSGHDSVDYMQSSGYLHQGHDHVPMQSTGGIQSETKASSQVHSMESSSHSLFTRNQNQSGMILQTPSKKQFHMMENKIEGTKKGASADLDSLDVPDGSSLSTDLDEISLEATAFRQLQQVMLQLDLRTKLCIRDSLYRLARSAEQRHNFAGINDSGALVAEGTSKYAGLMDMETDTNPIDRTVAHLLFHRPSDSSNMPTSLPVKPNVKVHGSTSGPVMVTKKPPCQQVENESDDKISSTGKN